MKEAWPLKKNEPRTYNPGLPFFQTERQALGLRIYFSVILFFSTVAWSEVFSDSILLKVLITFFGVDMSGRFYGLFPAARIEALDFLHQDPFRALVLLFNVGVGALFIRDKHPRIAALALLVGFFIIGYSSFGRFFLFDMYGFLVLSIFVGTMAVPFFRRKFGFDNSIRRHLIFMLVLATLGFMYGSSSIVKLVVSGTSWITQNSFLSLMQIHKYIYDIQMTNIPLYKFVENFFPQTRLVDVTLLSATVLFEFMAIFSLFLGRYYFLFSVSLILFHFSNALILGIAAVPLSVFVIIFAIPWTNLKRRGARLVPSLNDRLSYRKMVLFCWLVPLGLFSFAWMVTSNSKCGGIDFLYPFSRFSMFTGAGRPDGGPGIYPGLRIRSPNGEDITKEFGRALYSNAYLLWLSSGCRVAETGKKVTGEERLRTICDLFESGPIRNRSTLPKKVLVHVANVKCNQPNACFEREISLGACEAKE